MKITFNPDQGINAIEVAGLMPGQAVQVTALNGAGSSAVSQYTAPEPTAVPDAPVTTD